MIEGVIGKAPKWFEVKTQANYNNLDKKTIRYVVFDVGNHC